MLNSKSLLLTIFMIGACFTLVSNQELQAQTNTCNFTYQQGYQVGRNLALSESYYNENFQIYQNTLSDFSHCTNYVPGVVEGYLKNRKSFSGPGQGSGDINYTCGTGATHTSCANAGGADQ